ncbi:hypothetical protein MSIMFB_05164 [Mycobacterium simulans]|uniref:Uncharacterized protein n=1 Tax=Mycobacterium simulans TaxID=627089 RepID=A0A7Z7ND07_9MYCO|nr:hypothetical protein MSIMFB_05164 [Mycobacterium simulans]
MRRIPVTREATPQIRGWVPDTLRAKEFTVTRAELDALAWLTDCAQQIALLARLAVDKGL